MNQTLLHLSLSAPLSRPHTSKPHSFYRSSNRLKHSNRIGSIQRPDLVNIPMLLNTRSIHSEQIDQSDLVSVWTIDADEHHADVVVKVPRHDIVSASSEDRSELGCNGVTALWIVRGVLDEIDVDVLVESGLYVVVAVHGVDELLKDALLVLWSDTATGCWAVGASCWVETIVGYAWHDWASKGSADGGEERNDC